MTATARREPPVKRYPALLLTWSNADDRDHIELTLARLDDFQPTAIQENEAGPWRVFFPSSSARDAAHAALGAERGGRVGVAPVDIDDENWAARSQMTLKAVTVGRLVVAPPWDLPAEAGRRPPLAVAGAPSRIVVVIEPSMGFGTGHHASTRLCLEACQRIDLGGQSVLDVGTGSGVLAIAAALLGAADVRGVDIDGDAVDSARQNAARNDVEDRVAFDVADFRHATLQAATVVFANLTGAAIGAAFDRLVDLTTPGGHLVLSGFTCEDVVARDDGPLATSPRVTVVDRVDEEGWRCLVMTKRPSSRPLVRHRRRLPFPRLRRLPHSS